MRSARLRSLAMHAVLALAAATVLLPVVWVGLAAFKTQIALLRGDWLFAPTLANFRELLFSRSSDYLAHFANSLIVAAVSTALVLFVATLAAYSITRMRWASAIPALILGFSLVFHMIPPITLVGPWYVMARSAGIDDTYTALVLSHLTLHLPIGIAVMSVFVRDIPVEIEEAARLDGCTTPQVLRRIVFPLVKPGLAAAGVLVFVFSWNEFAVALTLTGRQTATVPVAIARFAQQYETQHAQMAAASVISTIPAVLLMLLGQRFIVRGLTMGAVK